MSLDRRHVAAVVYDGLCTFEFGIVVEVFGLPRPELELDWYRFTVCSPEPGPLRTTAGVTVQAGEGVEALADAGTVVIPGWRDPHEVPPAPLVDGLRAARARGARLVSICSGVFVLAAAGLLDGRPVTTHWRYADLLIRRHPLVHVQPDVLYVDDGDILTSAGSAAGIDLCLHIVRSDFGAEIAAQVARRLVVPPHREGGQSQYVPRPLRRSAAPSLAPVLAWAQQQLDRPLTVGDLAEHAAMAPRTFARRFRDETGTTPHRWLVRQRLHEAQQRLESTDDDIERVARETGFVTAETLRHHFRRAFGTSPTSYRRRFRTAPT